MNIIVCGAAGFIGSNLCHWLVDNTEHTVIGLDNFATGQIKNMPSHQRFKPYNLNIDFEYLRLNDYFLHFKPSVCFALQAYAAEGRSNYIRRFIHVNNTISMANLINACVNHNCKLIFTSSVAVYSGNSPFDEYTIPNPIDEYGLSKWTSERSIQIAGETQGLDWCIVRPRNVYGKYQSIFDECRNVMGIWMYQILNKQPMTIFGDGTNQRCFTAIDDILEPLYNAINVSKEIINLGSPIPYSIRSANGILQSITGYDNVQYLEPRHEVQEAICDISKSEFLLNYEHKTYLEEGLKKMWKWAKTITMIERQTPPPLEINIKTHSSIK